MLKPKLLVVELWGLGDLAIASPFLRTAGEKYAVTLLAKPFAQDLQPRFWPGVEVVPFLAPWTAFRNKYRLNSWPWRQLFRLRKQLASERFEVGLSARWDPRDHVLLKMFGPKKRFGFSRFKSQLFLTHPITRPMPEAHRYEYWRVLGQELGLDLPLRDRVPMALASRNRVILVHTGAGQAVRVWSLEGYRNLVRRLRESNYAVQVTCDLSQREWWIKQGEKEVATPETVTELLQLTDQSGLFIGNDSGPGHIAAFCGLPTFTIFGPQLPEWFAPLHPQAEWLEGKACPYKPCFDYCRFPVPRCMENISETEVWSNVEKFVHRHLPK
jgi:heptosyltransferase-2